MISPEYLSGMLNFLEVHKELTESILQDIVRRIVKTDFTITETAELQTEILQQSGMCFDEILERISESTSKTREEIKAIYDESETEIFDIPDSVLTANGIEPTRFKSLSPEMSKMYKASLSASTKEIINLTRTTAATSQNAFINCCNVAQMQIMSGAFSYQEAIKQAIISAAQKDVQVLYPTGHRTSLDAACRRAVLTGFNQTCIKMQEMRADEFDIDIMEITAHFGARPTHAEWQGQLVSRSGREGYLSLDDIGYGKVDGFMGANCRHDWNLFFEGSKRLYSDEELERLKNQTVTYDGEKLKAHKAIEKQRELERYIKKDKRELVCLDTGIKSTTDAKLKEELSKEFEKKAVKLKEHEAKLVDFCAQTGLNRDRYREQQFAVKTEQGISSWTKSVSGKAVHAAQEHYDIWRKSIGAENTPETLAKYYDMKYNDKKEFARLDKYKTVVNKGEASPLLGYAAYREKCLEIEKDLIGVVTSNGITVEDYSAHFVCRAIGSTNKPKGNEPIKEPVSNRDIKDALVNGKVGKRQINENGEPSILFISNKCKVAVNPDSKKLVQTNAREEK